MPIYKDEKRKSWYISTSYKDFDGTQRRKVKRGFKTQREAKQFEMDFLNSIAGSPTITFKSLAEIYLTDIQKRLKFATHYNRKSIINSYLLPFFSDLPINEITPATIRQWQNTLIGEYAPSTQHQINNVLTTILNYACKFHGLKNNPCSIAGGIGTPKRAKADIKFWTLEEFNKAILHTKYNSVDSIIFNILYYSGIRIGELLALTVGDFNQQEKYINICKTINPNTKKTQPPKTESSYRKVYLPAKICDLLQNYIDSLTIEGHYKPKANTILFNIAMVTVRDHFNKLCKAANVSKIRLHDLRHSHASLLINLGVPPLAISERLGHENVKITLQIYAHLYPNKQEDIVSKLDNIML